MTQENTTAMKAVKDKIILPMVLALPKYDGTYTPDTNDCNVQVCCVILQEQKDGTERPSGYSSRFLSDAQRANDTSRCKSYTVVRTVLLLRPFLYGTKLTIRTDPDSLKWILNLADATGMLAR